MNNSTIIIVVVIILILYLIFSQKETVKYVPIYREVKVPVSNKSGAINPFSVENMNVKSTDLSQQDMVEIEREQFSDAIKKQDLYSLYDPLTYPQLRLPREVLERYHDYYAKHGSYPPFNQLTQPYLFDNPLLNGLLIKEVDPNEPFGNNVPNAIPLIRVRSVKNADRYFYYIIDQQYQSRIEPKVPLDDVVVNGKRYTNTDFYGLPELFDGDCIEGFYLYPGIRFRVKLYKSYHFP